MKYILCLFLIIACKPAQWPANITVEEEFAPQIKECLKDLDARFTPNLTGSLDKTHFKITITVFGLEEPALGMAMPGDDSCGIILTESLFTINKDKLQTAVWHEVGHCAGLEHSDNPNDIMYYAADSFDSYSEGALQRFIDDVSKVLKRKQQ